MSKTTPFLYAALSLAIASNSASAVSFDQTLGAQFDDIIHKTKTQNKGRQDPFKAMKELVPPEEQARYAEELVPKIYAANEALSQEEQDFTHSVLTRMNSPEMAKALRDFLSLGVENAPDFRKLSAKEKTARVNEALNDLLQESTDGNGAVRFAVLMASKPDPKVRYGAIDALKSDPELAPLIDKAKEIEVNGARFSPEELNAMKAAIAKLSGPEASKTAFEKFAKELADIAAKVANGLPPPQRPTENQLKLFVEGRSNRFSDIREHFIAAARAAFEKATP